MTTTKTKKGTRRKVELDEVERIRQVRRDIAREFQTFEAYADYLQELDRQHWARLRKPRPAAKVKRTPNKSPKRKRSA